MIQSRWPAIAIAFCLTGCVAAPAPRPTPEPNRPTPAITAQSCGDVNGNGDPWDDLNLATGACNEPQRTPLAEPKRESGGGSCEYRPTMNYDWHDDYVCGGERQYFLPEDDFVTAEEMEAAARKWEASH